MGRFGSCDVMCICLAGLWLGAQGASESCVGVSGAGKKAVVASGGYLLGGAYSTLA